MYIAKEMLANYKRESSVNYLKIPCRGGEMYYYLPTFKPYEEVFT